MFQNFYFSSSHSRAGCPVQRRYQQRRRRRSSAFPSRRISFVAQLPSIEFFRRASVGTQGRALQRNSSNNPREREYESISDRITTSVAAAASRPTGPAAACGIRAELYLASQQRIHSAVIDHENQKIRSLPAQLNPMFAPSSAYIAGADHPPVNFSPPRHVIPRARNSRRPQSPIFSPRAAPGHTAPFSGVPSECYPASQNFLQHNPDSFTRSASRLAANAGTLTDKNALADKNKTAKLLHNPLLKRV